MARFYGTVQGARGRATRLGHATSGLDVSAQSFSGDVCVCLRDEEGEDHAHIYVRPHGGGAYRTIYRGPIEAILNQSGRKTLLETLAVDVLVNG